MTVEDLIQELQQYPSGTMVVVKGYEGGYSDVGGTSTINLNLNVNHEPYYGAHERNDDGDTEAILID